ncbi:DUF4064 domain-containing protein [Alkalicoccobacillus porphyridii]|uniref:DUF4064 domain-containing protein n=1 Tax=Alkalicoccobacillus porphyridii TaxID=2597270 RepID=A0A553ZUL1_9BACI|nr:DUF4064 domain-containing protein [Alkalicoccobacillus porphyridii]TSB45005.1 DUF4064 domain-containing protein [Alkalicoccobacillus porphyridii]
MNRTTEIVLGTVGSTLHLICTVIAFMVYRFIFSLNADLQETNQQFIADHGIWQEGGYYFNGVNLFLSLMLMIYIGSLVLGIIATVFVKKRTIMAGVFFLISGVISLVTFIPAILYIIAGVMALVRKPTPKQLNS